jgi:hypothetical protein
MNESNGDRTVDLDALDLAPHQRRCAEHLLTVRRGLRGEAVIDADQQAELWPWILGGEPGAPFPECMTMTIATPHTFTEQQARAVRLLAGPWPAEGGRHRTYRALVGGLLRDELAPLPERTPGRDQS